MEREEYSERAKEMVRILKSHRTLIIAVLFFTFGMGALSSLIVFKPSTGWEDLSAFSTWFYAVIAFSTLFVILITEIFAVHQIKLVGQQLALVSTDIKASNYSQIYARTDAALSLLLNEAVILRRLQLDARQVEELEDRAFHFTDRTRLVVNMLFTLLENVYYQHEKFHVLDDEDWNTWKVSFKQIFGIPYVRACWDRKKPGR